MPLGSFILVLSIILTSLCQEKQVYQFFLAQGLLFGLGTAVV